MSDSRCVVVGASHAAISLVASLRAEGWSGMITLIDEDPCLPYHRPPLSKGYLNGKQALSDIFLRPASFYEAQNIDLILGSRVEKIERDKQRVVLHDGAEVPYTRLALTMGSRVRKINLPGSNLPGVFYLRTLQDVDGIRTYTGKRKSAVIIGGGYIGLEAAAALRSAGMEVTVLEALPRVLQRVTAPEVSAFYSRVHRDHGVSIVTGVQVASIEGESCVKAVSCVDGSRFSADLVIVGVGVTPNVSLAERAGLRTDDGVVVDEYARTSDPKIVAAGDCTRHYNALYGRMLRLESVQNAVEQAKTAAHTLCGKMVPYQALPWFWSDQFNIKLQIAGLSQGFDQVVYRGDHNSGESFSAFYYSNGELIAVDAINRPKDFMLGKKALSNKVSPDPRIVADESNDIRKVFNDLAVVR